MAKKIRFPLLMAENTQVRTLEELKENFNLEAMLEYYNNGKLLTWLRDRYLETEAEAVAALDSSAPDFQKQLCAIFGAEYTGDGPDLEEIQLRQERLKRLREITEEPEFLAHIDQVAFDQEELADLLDEEAKTIYLCGTRFVIPLSQKGVSYIGVNHPLLHLSGLIPDDMSETGITFQGCETDNWPEPKQRSWTGTQLNTVYAVYDDEPIPEDVDETGSLEVFLSDIYKQLGLSTDTAIDLTLYAEIDGVTINGVIEMGRLIHPLTCGENDMAVEVLRMNGFNLLNSESSVNRGEIQLVAFVTNDDMKRASEYLNLKTPYVSNRHAASGIVNRLTSSEDDELLQFISLYPIEAEGLEGTYEERMDFLQNFGVVPDDMIDRKVISGNLEDLLEQIEKRFEKLEKKREKLSYAIDGMVITVADADYQQTLGRTGRTNNYQIALKFDPATAEATVKGCYLDFGKKGYRTIQVNLEHPVFLGGVRYDHVPVLSLNLFEDLGLRMGSVVKVHRTGDVIPALSVVKHGSNPVIEIPDKCPECGEPLEVKNKKLFCGNIACPANTAGKFQGFLEGIGMEGYGEEFCSMIADVDGPYGAASISDLFKLKSENFTGKVGKAFPKALRKAVSETPDYKILGSMGIPEIGPARAKALLKCAMEYLNEKENLRTAEDAPTTAWQSLVNMLDFGNHFHNPEKCGQTGRDFSYFFEEYTERALGEKTARKLSRYVDDHGYLTISLEEYVPLYDEKQPIRAIKDVKYDSESGKAVTATYPLWSKLVTDMVAVGKYIKKFTTDFEDKIQVGHTGYTPSDEVEEACEKHGMELTGSKHFDILITNSKDSNTDKMQTAKKKGIPIYTEEEFLEQYGDGVVVPKKQSQRKVETVAETPKGNGKIKEIVCDDGLTLIFPV